ncbi:hypothetical protein DL98DRAFT_393911, partial [Cadophora sp. DSE1049]
SQRNAVLEERPNIFPEFLLPGTFDINLKAFKKTISQAIVARKYTPLMPIHVSRRLMENSFSEIFAEHQFIDFSTFMRLLETQYASSSRDPSKCPARWAVVNAILALGVRFKTAAGSEAAMGDVVKGFYNNGIAVLPELMLREPSLLAVQALLAMAMFARGVPDLQAFVMLVTNASRLLQLLS